jgi:hypothetical protein
MESQIAKPTKDGIPNSKPLKKRRLPTLAAGVKKPQRVKEDRPYLNFAFALKFVSMHARSLTSE